ncbi:flavin reductase family protein [Marinobacterium aestuariivivens]|uniref:Flavin reductase family protein n=1 Tax=Marinobacterium aestuariivivens TaxID=1698799 RepID=A0ABW2A5Y9_9GAMM
MTTMNAPTTAIRSEETVEVQAFDSRELRNTLGLYATGVTVVTTTGAEAGEPIGITANSFSSLSLDPPLILWSLALKSPSLLAFAEGRDFAVNILEHRQDALAMQFARPSDDKFAGVSHRRNDAGVPLLDDALAQLECRVEFTRVAGDHLLIVGRVLAFSKADGEPLLFYKGGFQQLCA